MNATAEMPQGRPPHRIPLADEMPGALAPLMAEPRWLVWRWKFVPGKAGRPPRWTKVPYQAARPDRFAKSNDPTTWGSHADACAAVAAGRAHGIGFALDGSQWGAFDLDDCRDPETGRITAWALDLIERAASYVEVTVSGTGLRIIGRATGPTIHRKLAVPGPEGGSVEPYRNAARYIVVTGCATEESAGGMVDIDAVMDAALAELDPAPEPRPEPVGERPRERPRYDDGPRRELPADLERLIREGAPEGQRSEAFMHAVGWLKDYGWSPAAIASLLAQYPGGIGSKYGRRLEAEVERCWAKAETRDRPRGEYRADPGPAPSADPDPGPAGRGARPEPAPIPLRWHRDADPDADRAWLVAEMIAEVGKGLLSGQWGSAKTFIALDLSGCVMMGEPFAGRRVLRRGGVLFIAPEGAFEIPIRLRGLVTGKVLASIDAGRVTAPTLDPADLPFAWIEECPRLVAGDAAETLILTAEAAAAEMEERYGLPLALVIVDTVAAGAGFDDENSAAETQKAMNALERLAQRTGAFVLGVDHFGKAVETGTRGSSAKEAAADTVLAALATRDEAGNVSNTRLALRKVRGARTGMETPYSLDVVQIGENRWGEPVTTCTISWQTERQAETVTAPRDRWPTSLRIFRTALMNVLAEKDQARRIRPFGGEGPEVLAATDKAVRAEFCAAYPADGETAEKRTDAKSKAFKRARGQALDKGLIGARDLGGIDYLWPATDP